MKDKKELLLSYIKANTVPIIEDIIFWKDLIDAEVIPADISREELNGHYEEDKYLPPKWLSKLLKTKEHKLLVIDKLDSIPKEEQTKFCELLEARKISTFELPENIILMVTAEKINKERINEEIFSLVARVWGDNYELWYLSFKKKNVG